jgi:hypothetical protein
VSYSFHFSQLAFKVPEESLGGHAFHTYRLESPDNRYGLPVARYRAGHEHVAQLEIAEYSQWPINILTYPRSI